MDIIFCLTLLSTQESLNEDLNWRYVFLYQFVLIVINWTSKEWMFLYILDRRPRIIVHLKNFLDKILQLRAYWYPFGKGVFQSFYSSNCLLEGLSLKWTNSKFHPVKNNPKRPNIRRKRVSESSCHLRWQKIRRPTCLSFQFLVTLEFTCEPEIAYLNFIVGSDEAVAQFKAK